MEGFPPGLSDAQGSPRSTTTVHTAASVGELNSERGGQGQCEHRAETSSAHWVLPPVGVKELGGHLLSLGVCSATSATLRFSARCPH